MGKCCGFPGGGGGGGGGNLSGTLTPNHVPYASAAHTLSDSPLTLDTGTGALSTPSDLFVGADISFAAGLGQIQSEFLWVHSDAAIDGLLSLGVPGLNINTGKFVVDGATGDTTVAGTLTVDEEAVFNKRTRMPPVPITAAPTVTLDSLDGDIFSLIAIDQNVAMAAPLHPVDGARILLEFSGQGNGAWVITWDAVFDFGAGGAPAPDLSSTYNVLYYLGFYYSAWNLKWNCIGPLAGAF